jgi:hypothetical protein
MFPAASFDQDTLNLLSRVFDDAWIEMQLMLGAKPLDPTTIGVGIATW